MKNIIKFFPKENFHWILLGLSLACLLFLFPPIQNAFSFLCKNEVLDFRDRCDFLSFSVISFFFFFLSGNILYSLRENWNEVKTQKIHLLSLTIFWLYLFATHLKLNFCGDDLTYQHFLDNSSLADYLAMKYYGLGSRLVIEPCLIGFTNAPIFFWHFFDSIFTALTFEAIALIVLPTNKLKYSFLVFLSFLLIPKSVFCDAGWCATTMNYVWPLALFLFVSLKFKKIIENKEISLFEKVSVGLATVYAANMELVAALIVGYSVIFILYQNYTLRKNNKKTQFSIDSTCIIVVVISVISLIFILTCPGNASRAALETQVWYPNYVDLSLVDKLELGVISTFPFFYCSGFILYPFNILLLTCLSFLILLLTHKKQYRNLYLLVPSIIILFFFGLYPLMKINLFHSVADLKQLYFTNIHLVNFNGIPKIEVNLGMSPSLIWAEAISYLFTFALFLFCVYRTIGNKSKALLCVLILCSGLTSRLVMGFSPTVYGSGSRTFLFFCVAIIIVTFFIISDYIRVSNDSIKCVLLFICIILAFVIAKFDDFFPSEKVTNSEAAVTISHETNTNSNKANGFRLESCNQSLLSGDNPNLKVDDKYGLVLTGWALDADKKEILDRLLVVVGSDTINCDYGKNRKDVCDAFALDCSPNLGFVCNIPINVLKKSDGSKIEQIYFVLVGKDNAFLYDVAPFSVQY